MEVIPRAQNIVVIGDPLLMKEDLARILSTHFNYSILVPDLIFLEKAKEFIKKKNFNPPPPKEEEPPEEPKEGEEGEKKPEKKVEAPPPPTNEFEIVFETKTVANQTLFKHVKDEMLSPSRNFKGYVYPLSLQYLDDEEKDSTLKFLNVLQDPSFNASTKPTAVVYLHLDPEEKNFRIQQDLNIRKQRVQEIEKTLFEMDQPKKKPKPSAPETPPQPQDGEQTDPENPPAEPVPEQPPAEEEPPEEPETEEQIIEKKKKRYSLVIECAVHQNWIAKYSKIIDEEQQAENEIPKTDLQLFQFLAQNLENVLCIDLNANLQTPKQLFYEILQQIGDTFLPFSQVISVAKYLKASAPPGENNEAPSEEENTEAEFDEKETEKKLLKERFQFPLIWRHFCPVAFAKAKKIIAGNLKFGAICGRTVYKMATKENLEEFLKNPLPFIENTEPKLHVAVGFFGNILADSHLKTFSTISEKYSAKVMSFTDYQAFRSEPENNKLTINSENPIIFIDCVSKYETQPILSVIPIPPPPPGEEQPPEPVKPTKNAKKPLPPPKPFYFPNFFVLLQNEDPVEEAAPAEAQPPAEGEGQPEKTEAEVAEEEKKKKEAEEKAKKPKNPEFEREAYDNFLKEVTTRSEGLKERDPTLDIALKPISFTKDEIPNAFDNICLSFDPLFVAAPKPNPEGGENQENPEEEQQESNEDDPEAAKKKSLKKKQGFPFNKKYKDLQSLKPPRVFLCGETCSKREEILEYISKQYDIPVFKFSLDFIHNLLVSKSQQKRNGFVVENPFKPVQDVILRQKQAKEAAAEAKKQKLQKKEGEEEPAEPEPEQEEDPEAAQQKKDKEMMEIVKELLTNCEPYKTKGWIVDNFPSMENDKEINFFLENDLKPDVVLRLKVAEEYFLSQEAPKMIKKQAVEFAMKKKDKEAKARQKKLESKSKPRKKPEDDQNQDQNPEEEEEKPMKTKEEIEDELKEKFNAHNEMFTNTLCSETVCKEKDFSVVEFDGQLPIRLLKVKMSDSILNSLLISEQRKSLVFGYEIISHAEAMQILREGKKSISQKFKFLDCVEIAKTIQTKNCILRSNFQNALTIAFETEEKLQRQKELVIEEPKPPKKEGEEEENQEEELSEEEKQKKEEEEKLRKFGPKKELSCPVILENEVFFFISEENRKEFLKRMYYFLFDEEFHSKIPESGSPKRETFALHPKFFINPSNPLFADSAISENQEEAPNDRKEVNACSEISKALCEDFNLIRIDIDSILEAAITQKTGFALNELQIDPQIIDRLFLYNPKPKTIEEKDKVDKEKQIFLNSLKNNLPFELKQKLLLHKIETFEAKIKGFVLDSFIFTNNETELNNFTRFIEIELPSTTKPAFNFDFFFIMKNYQDFYQNSIDAMISRINEMYQNVNYYDISILTDFQIIFQVRNAISEFLRRKYDFIVKTEANSEEIKQIPANIKDCGLLKSRIFSNLSKFGTYCPVSFVNFQKLIEMSQHDEKREFVYLYKSNFYFISPSKCSEFVSNPEFFLKDDNLNSFPKDLPSTQYSFTSNAYYNTLANEESFIDNNEGSQSDDSMDDNDDDAFELHGFCAVEMKKLKFGQPVMKRGKSLFTAAYKGKLFKFWSENNLKEFMQQPWKFYVSSASDVKSPKNHHHASVVPTSFPLKTIPVPRKNWEDLEVIEYMEESVQNLLTQALVFVGKLRPKYPGLSVSQSSLVFLSLFLKAHNEEAMHVTKVADRETFYNYKDTYNEFVRICEIMAKPNSAKSKDDLAKLIGCTPKEFLE